MRMTCSCEECQCDRARERTDEDGRKLQAIVDRAYIQTFTGRQVWPFALKASDIQILDIAHALSLICRYNGHTSKHYSVAEHSVLVAAALPPEFRREGFLHDSTEAYLGDVSGPLKRLPAFEEYRDAESRAQSTIFDVFGIVSTPESRAAVREVDLRILANEAAALLGPPVANWTGGITPLPDTIVDAWPARFAEEVFLDMFETIFETKVVRPC